LLTSGKARWRLIARSGQSIWSTNPAWWIAVVLLFHDVGEARQIGLTARVVLVLQEVRDDAG
jgi:hypothetical protein